MPHPLHLRVDRTALIERANGPLDTVIMPAFNAQETIAAALGSLLCQTHWLRADPSMIFQAHGRHPYKIVGKSTASLMVPRGLFGVLGPWDNAQRGAADFEFSKRVETRFGAVHHLSRFLPLAVSLHTPGSLTGESATGIRRCGEGAHRRGAPPIPRSIHRLESGRELALRIWA
jgi:hypothetical protein